jgi:hypothetical protein
MNKAVSQVYVIDVRQPFFMIYTDVFMNAASLYGSIE